MTKNGFWVDSVGSRAMLAEAAGADVGVCAEACDGAAVLDGGGGGGESGDGDDDDVGCPSRVVCDAVPLLFT
eukprot:CAMPEP_0119562248 /NCGR_PEP_ID=MMETSP1352-20130426/19893_1 /TAXON_ID=265584 /ORGANISM="Stauroneis constricta, Strain CCMP1120" /LENGTH=71 /DNA_ID=CAMNT_0007610609 /DNA_START=79 /DNA_END=290 /DNA_ORIENTATION=+